MSGLQDQAKFLIQHSLKLFAVGKRFHLPQPAPGVHLQKSFNQELRIEIPHRIEPIAKFSEGVQRITLTTAWICKRWCSAYHLLGLARGPSNAGSMPVWVQPSDNFFWPESVPLPQTEGNSRVVETNNVFPWVVTATVLHELGHAFRVGEGLPRASAELACDQFASKYLVGTTEFPSRDVRMLALGIWQSCMCSESLNYGDWKSTDYPHPVIRMLTCLEEFVAEETPVGNSIWKLCVAHIVLLARAFERPSADDMLSRNYASSPSLLNALSQCW